MSCGESSDDFWQCFMLFLEGLEFVETFVSDVRLLL